MRGRKKKLGRNWIWEARGGRARGVISGYNTLYRTRIQWVPAFRMSSRHRKEQVPYGTALSGDFGEGPGPGPPPTNTHTHIGLNYNLCKLPGWTIRWSLLRGLTAQGEWQQMACSLSSSHLSHYLFLCRNTGRIPIPNSPARPVCSPHSARHPSVGQEAHGASANRPRPRWIWRQESDQ